MERDRAKQVQRTTVNRELTTLKHMLKIAVRCELTTNNPAAGISPFPVQEGRIRFATEEELPPLIDSCKINLLHLGFIPWLCWR